MRGPGLSKGVWVFIAIAGVVLVCGGLYLIFGRAAPAGSAAVQRVEKLESQGKLEAVAEQAQSDQKDAAVAAVHSLGNMGTRGMDVQVRLEKTVRDARPEVRVAAAEEIGRVAAAQGVQRVPPPLMQAALSDEDADVRAAAAKALGAMRSPDTLETLLDGLADDDVQVRRCAIEALHATIGVKYAFDPEGGEGERARVIELIRADLPRFKAYLLQKQRSKQP